MRIILFKIIFTSKIGKENSFSILDLPYSKENPWQNINHIIARLCSKMSPAAGIAVAKASREVQKKILLPRMNKILL